MTAAETFELQRKLDHAEMNLHSVLFNEDGESDATGTREAEFRARVDELRAQVEVAQAEIGGYVGRIPSDNMDRFQKKLVAMAKRAAKVGATAPVAIDTGETEEEAITAPDPFEPGAVVVVGKRVWSYIAIKGETPKLAGWTFLATLQHSEGGTIIRRVPGATAAESEELEAKFDLSNYRDAKPVCDHCQTRRERKDTYIVVHEDGTVKQVGRNCVGDFTGGQSPESLLRTMQYLREVEDMVRSDEYEAAGGIVVRTLDTEEFLTHVACMVREFGWVPRSYHNGAASADVAVQNLRDLQNNKRDKQGLPEFVIPSEADRTDAQAAIAHARDLEATSDFEHNLKVAVGTENMDERNTGIAAAAILVYNRHIEREVERKLTEERDADAVNEHVGEIKDRLDLVLTVERVHEHPGHYGTTFITKMRDAEGRTFTWFGSYEIDRGAVVTGKWTVKDHSDYQGTKETILTRPARDLSWEVPAEADEDGEEQAEDKGQPCECELESHECSGPATHTFVSTVKGGGSLKVKVPICAEAARIYQESYDSIPEGHPGRDVLKPPQPINEEVSA